MEYGTVKGLVGMLLGSMHRPIRGAAEFGSMDHEGRILTPFPKTVPADVGAHVPPAQSVVRMLSQTAFPLLGAQLCRALPHDF